MKIAIIGLGLIGGSIGMALKRANIKDMQVVGYDDEVSEGKRAVKLGAVDKAPWRLHEVIDGASMVIVATPVLAIREILETLGSMLGPGCVVTDTGSTKEVVISWADEYLPPGVSFVGGHPMAGKELSGIDNADPDLFMGSRYVVIPAKKATKESVKAVLDMVDVLGARPFFVDAAEHDSYVAAVSHLPILLSVALVSAVTKSQSWREISKLASTGFRDVSRLASGDPVMSLDICVTNRQSIYYWIGEAIKELEVYRDMVGAAGSDGGADELGGALSKAWADRERWINRYESGGDFDDDRAPSADIPSTGASMVEFMIGGRLRERYQKLLSLQQRRSDDRRPRRLRRP
jgi:prephenate dehydrogenase